MFAAQRQHPVEMAAQRVVSIRIMLFTGHKKRIEIKPAQPPPPDKLLKLRVGQIAQMFANRAEIRVRGDNRRVRLRKNGVDSKVV